MTQRGAVAVRIRTRFVGTGELSHYDPFERRSRLTSGARYREGLARTKADGWERAAAYPPPCGEGRSPQASGVGVVVIARSAATATNNYPTPALRADPPHKGEGKKTPRLPGARLDHRRTRILCQRPPDRAEIRFLLVAQRRVDVAKGAPHNHRGVKHRIQTIAGRIEALQRRGKCLARAGGRNRLRHLQRDLTQHLQQI